MQEFLELIFDLFTLKSRKRGPLVVLAELRDRHVHLTLENRGKRRIEFAAVQCHDENGKRQFPKSDMAPRTVIHPGRAERLRIAALELRSLNCQRLAVLDSTGSTWSVEGLDPSVLDA